MTRIIKDCPSCGGKMKITTLRCPDCGLEIKNEFEPETFSSLTDEQAAFLRSFLKNRGQIRENGSDLFAIVFNIFLTALLHFIFFGHRC